MFHVLFAELTDLLPFPVMLCSWIVSQVTSVSWRLWAPTVASHFQVMHTSMFVSIIMLILKDDDCVSSVSREAKEHLCWLFDYCAKRTLVVCRLLGTPTEEVWPGVNKLRDWHEYPHWQPQSISRVVPDLDPQGVDLLSVCPSSLFFVRL